MKKAMLIIFTICVSTNVFSDVGNYEVTDILTRWNDKIEENRAQLAESALDAQDNDNHNQYLELSNKIDELEDISELITEKSL